jgi:Domain of unknown function (DUF4351)
MTQFPHDELAKFFLDSFGSPLLAKIQALPLEQVELLGEDLLDFTSIDNLEQWLSRN